MSKRTKRPVVVDGVRLMSEHCRPVRVLWVDHYDPPEPWGTPAECSSMPREVIESIGWITGENAHMIELAGDRPCTPHSGGMGFGGRRRILKCCILWRSDE